MLKKENTAKILIFLFNINFLILKMFLIFLMKMIMSKLLGKYMEQMQDTGLLKKISYLCGLKLKNSLVLRQVGMNMNSW